MLSSKQQSRKKTRAAINQPMTPNSIPLPPQPLHPPPMKSHRSSNALSFNPIDGLPAVLRVPTILILLIVVSYAIGKAGFSFIFLLPVGHVAYYVFSRRVTEYRRSLEALSRDATRDENTFETVEWINHTIKKFWDVSEQSVSSIIFNEVNNVLNKVSKTLPIGLRMLEITLGSRPPVIERISFTQTAENRLILECAANFIPVNASEEILVYFKNERTHWNTYIEIQVTLGSLITIPILVRDFTFSGIFRIELELSRQLPFAKKLSFSFLEMPVIDLKLIPLRSVDMLDLPYIGGILNTVIESQVKSRVLEPKRIEVDLEEIAKMRGEVIGVVYVFVHDLETQDECIHWITLENGEWMGTTAKRGGRNPGFNEGFYGIVRDTSEAIDLTLFTAEGQAKTGRINLRNLNRHIYAESVCLASNKGRAFANVTTQFYPLSEEVQGSAIVHLSLISLRDIQCVGDPANRLYSTYCIVSLVSSVACPTPRTLKRFESKRIFTTRDPFYNETFKFFVREFEEYTVKIDVMNDRDNKLLGSVVIGCADMKTSGVGKYRVCGLESGDMHLRFNLKYINMTDQADDQVVPDLAVGQEAAPAVVEDGREAVLGGYINTPARTGDHTEGQAPPRPTASKPVRGITTKTIPSQEFVYFKSAVKVSVKSISTSGVFYFVFETSRMNVKLGPFTTEIEIKEEAVIPILDEAEVVVRLFRLTVNGDTFVGEERMETGGGVVVFGKIRVEFETTTAALDDKGVFDDDGSVKIVQVRLGEIRGSGDFTVEYRQREQVMNQKLIHRLGTFLVGAERLCCELKRSNRVVSSVMVPLRECREEISFGDGVSAIVQSRVQSSGFKRARKSVEGELEVYLIKASGIGKRAGEAGTYVKVELNGDRIHKTNGKRGSEPIFNESMRIRVQKKEDELRFLLYGLDSVGVDQVLGMVDLALFNVVEGFSRHELRLKGEGEEEVKLQIILSYKLVR